MVPLVSGGFYERGVEVFTLIFVDVKEVDGENISRYAMLHLCRHVVKGMTCPMFQHNKNGTQVFTKKELEEDFNLKDWKFLDGRLRVERIDEDSFIDYVINGSGPMEDNAVYPTFLKDAAKG